jgi:pilus assembly protein Flp/PilA
MMNAIKRFIREERGQGLAEYGLIIALVAIVLIGSLTALNGGLQNVFTAIVDGFTP